MLLNSKTYELNCDLAADRIAALDPSLPVIGTISCEGQINCITYVDQTLVAAARTISSAVIPNSGNWGLVGENGTIYTQIEVPGALQIIRPDRCTYNRLDQIEIRHSSIEKGRFIVSGDGGKMGYVDIVDGRYCVLKVNKTASELARMRIQTALYPIFNVRIGGY